MKKSTRFGLDDQEWQDLWYIFSRNVFLLTNGIIALVVVLLLFVGDVEAGIFLGIVLLVNMTLGFGQDIRAWYALKRLQFLTAPRVTRLLADGSEESVLTEEIKEGDQLKIKTGDEVPCDGRLLEAHSLELNEGLLTGEAASFSRQAGEHILAGSIITAGSGLLMTDTVFQESRIARMTEGIKGYSGSESPIQRAVSQVIRYSGYVLLIAIAFVVARGFLVGESLVVVIKNIGALASSIVPQGLAFAMTLLFAYGAAHLYRRNVLLQEINATEKLGRIKNLCMDKTGTLTENRPSVEKIEIAPHSSLAEARAAAAAYVAGSGDTSQTMLALKEYIGESTVESQVLALHAFSSWHPYGAVELLQTDGTTEVLVAGAPEYLMRHVAPGPERSWFEKIEAEARQGKRIFCLARAHVAHLPNELGETELSPLAVFVLSSSLRPGIVDAIRFFQERGVRIRIISGDHPETVRAVARLAGVKECDHVVTGQEMKEWTEEDFSERARHYSLFARTVPEQKEKIIQALKQDGFTAMVGDGANDALAIKRADLGIAMFEGAPATRKLASVVLMNNSFTALPDGVTLADSIIKNAEIFAALFFGTALSGLFLFIGVSLLGAPFPLTPLNITFINYFTVGFPGILVSYWTIWPTDTMPAPQSGAFLKKVAPFIVASVFLQSIVFLAIYVLSPISMQRSASDLWIVLTSIMTGYIFFLFAPGMYRGVLLFSQRRDLLILTIVEILFLAFVFRVPFLLRFFEIVGDFPQIEVIHLPLLFLVLYALCQYGVGRFLRQRP